MRRDAGDERRAVRARRPSSLDLDLAFLDFFAHKEVLDANVLGAFGELCVAVHDRDGRLVVFVDGQGLELYQSLSNHILPLRCVGALVYLFPTLKNLY